MYENKFQLFKPPVWYLLLEIPRQPQQTTKGPRSQSDLVAELGFHPPSEAEDHMIRQNVILLPNCVNASEP